MGTKRKVFLIISTAAIGGSEKRFIGLWLFAQKVSAGFSLHLCISPDLYKIITQLEEFQDLSNYKDKIHFINWVHGSIFQKQPIYEELSEVIGKDDVLHFVSSFPLYSKIKNVSLFSFTESSLGNVNFKGRLAYYFSFFKADYIDVLDPGVFSKLKGNPFFRHKAHLTDCSFVDESYFGHVDIARKKNRIVHLGRFVKGKQIELFVKALPVIDRVLKERNIHCEYIIIGYGPLEDELRQIVSGDDYKEIDISLLYSQNPREYLQSSKVIVSVQLANNYPSKALIEGIAAGNIPLVTDVGDTRLLAHPEFSYYVSKTVDPREMASQIYSILSLPFNEFEHKAKKGMQFVKKNFTIEKMYSYYESSYIKILKSHV